MDLYDETENVISSDDEYTDQEDDFMNEVIVSQNISKSESIASSSPLKFTDLSEPAQEYTKRELIQSKIIRRNHIREKNYEIVYKKKYVNWANNVHRRQKYKQFLMSLKQCNYSGSVEKQIVNKNALVNDEIQSETILSNGTEVLCINAINENDVQNHQNNGNNLKTNGESASKLPIDENKNNQVKTDDMQVCGKDLSPTSKKGSHSPTAVIEITENRQNNDTDSKTEDITTLPTKANTNTTTEKLETKLETKDTNMPFYKEINEMFPKYDGVIGRHVKAKSSSVAAIDETVSRTLLDIQTLNNILHTKELEWNRLLHLKKVKEEMLARFLRKKHLMELKEKSFGEENYTMSDLNELVANLSDSNITMITKNTVPLTIQQLVESRANMKKDDLEKEQFNTKRLHSILVSNNILPSADAVQNHLASNQEGVSVSSKYQPYDKEALSNLQIGNDKSHNAKRRYGSDSVNFSPTLERLLSATATTIDHNRKRDATPSFDQGFKYSNISIGQHESQNSNCYRLQNISDQLCNEVSIIPVPSGKAVIQKDQKYKMNFTRPKSNATKLRSVYMDSSYDKMLYENSDNDRDNAVKKSEVPICQECRAHESRFVCGGCGNQWYCSRNCQISAWDNKHSETCNG